MVTHFVTGDKRGGKFSFTILLVCSVSFLMLSLTNRKIQSNAMNVHMVEHPNTAQAEVNLYNGPQVNAPKRSPIKTAASILAILCGWNDMCKWNSIRANEVCLNSQNGYKPECTIPFKRDVANIAKYAGNQCTGAAQQWEWHKCN